MKADGDAILLLPPTADGPATGLLLRTAGPAGDGLPVAAWLGEVPAGASWRAADLAALAVPGVPLLPQHADGWFGRPGLTGHRTDGRDWSASFTVTRIEQGADGAVTIDAHDEAAGLALRTEAEPVPGGLLRARHTLTNTAADPYHLDSLDVVLPLPRRAAEFLDFSGRWGLERVPQRRPVTDGTWLRESRRGRPGHDAAMLLTAGTAGFGFGHGEVWGLHVAWSGNQRVYVERQPSGLTTFGGGELLLPGELVLATGEGYTTPWVYAGAAADGLDGLAARFHTHLRSLPAHPARPRPVNLNVWEAVYFDHDLDRLVHLADLAAEVGVERYVLDDGWFHGRRSDTAGLGDWWVDEDVWPRGLGPLIDRVRGHGMEFGLWWEPEMVNPDSDLYRAHPDWILSTGGRVPPPVRNQLVLDLSRPEVRAHLLRQFDALLTAYPIDAVKWDHNRELVDAGSAGAAAAVHAHTAGYYALLDELRRRHPQVEWESCASGGGRIDLGVLSRVQRVWTSDVTDALSRQHIQRWTGQLVPPEYTGAHISAPRNHQTGRELPLGFRALTAMFGHFGIEWDLTRTTAEERAELAAWIACHREHRALLHSGRVVRLDTPDPSVLAHGVLAHDRSAALLAYVKLDESSADGPAPLTVPGLDPARRYRATLTGPLPDTVTAPPATVAPGSVLAAVGLPLPPLRPHTGVLVSLVAEA